MIPSVYVTEIDGGMGILPAALGDALVVIGPASAGPYNTPAAFTRSTLVRSNYGSSGELAEACSYHTDLRGLPVIPLRARATVAGNTGAAVNAADGTCGTITVVGTGTADPTIDGTHDLPNAAKDVVVRWAVGGTTGSGCTAIYQVSTNGGVSYGYARALGGTLYADLSPELGDVRVDVSTDKTIVAGDTWAFVTTAPVVASAGTLVVTSAAGAASVHAVVYGGMSAVAKTGTNPPAVTLSGTPAGLYALRIEITTGGARGTALFRWSTDNGATWAYTGVTTGASVALTGSGITAAFATGTYATNNVYTSDSIVTTGIPLEEADVYIEIVTGGAVGGAGITYTSSYDSGLTISPVTSLVGSTLTVDGVRLDLSGTFAAGDTITFSATPSAPTAVEISDAIASLRGCAIPFSIVYIAAPIGAAEFDAIEIAISSLSSVNKPVYWIGHPRRPNPGETEGEYATSVLGLFAAKATTHGSLVARDARVTSAITGFALRRSPALAVASATAAVSPEVDIADLTLGPLPGVQIVDSNGNPLFHDEAMSPGDDDLGFLALRSWAGRSGAFVNRPRIKCSNGSDFTISPYRRVMNLASKTLRSYLETRLSKSVRVSKKTGFIYGPDATEIENGARAAVMAVVGQKPMISGLTVVVSRSDNLLSTHELTIEMAIVPLAYVEGIDLTERFVNPARALKAV